jgi:hypothetical protein
MFIDEKSNNLVTQDINLNLKGFDITQNSLLNYGSGFSSIRLNQILSISTQVFFIFNTSVREAFYNSTSKSYSIINITHSSIPSSPLYGVPLDITTN